MTIEEIRALRLADPFKPFRLILVNGRELRVEKSYYLAISPTNKFLLFSTLAGEYAEFGVQHVKEASLLELPASTAGKGNA